LTQIKQHIEPGEEGIQAAIRRIPILTEGKGDWAVSSLPSFTNRTYRIARAGEAFVLRLPGRGTARYVDRVAEAANARSAAGIGLSPEVVFADPRRGLMLTRFVPGAEPLSAKRLEQPAELLATLALLRRLHDSGLTFRGHMRLYPKLDEYLGLADAPSLKALRREGERLRPILESGWGPARPCHIDPAPHNFIVAGGRRYLVDWEYSAMCEPLWDLAGVSIEGEFDAAQDANMLAEYFGMAERAWASRLHLYKIMLRLLAAAWGTVQLADCNGPAEIAELVDRLSARVQADLGAGDLGRHIEAA
jgi:thiamine kinase-like enzyme